MKSSGAVANELGISQSTVKRWVTVCNMEIERNSHGHYLFTDENIQQLKQIQQQLNEGFVLHQVALGEKKTRKGTILPMVQSPENQNVIEKLLISVQELERRLDDKADGVASYQLLQHRREIEDLNKKIESMANRIEVLETGRNNENERSTFDIDGSKKKRHIFQFLFG
ncbi:MerR family transcriptional regulator [Bacillus cihuensis]|uniref:MerR family transcriptional regulator n=1 Tax=Bacillus cihuensis TaxID=1208599 RepID=UPI00041199BC|nr:MerR family transcriptional regulator [Bacillus cihuensis]